MKLRVLGAVVALALSAVATAARADFISILGDGTVTAPASVNFGNSTTTPGNLNTIPVPSLRTPSLPSPYNFIDSWTFNLTNAADVTSFVGTLNFSTPNGTNGIDNIQLALFGPSGAISAWGASAPISIAPGVTQYFSVVSPTALASGAYSLRIRGTLIGSSSAYAGTLTALAPAGTEVPVPPALPLMAAGLLVLATLTRRRLRED